MFKDRVEDWLVWEAVGDVLGIVVGIGWFGKLLELGDGLDRVAVCYGGC